MKYQRQETNVKEPSVRWWVVCLAGALLCFAAAMIILTVQTPNWPLILFKNQSASVPSASQSEAPSTRMTYSINTLPVFADGNSEGNVEINSDQSNENNMQVRFVRRDNGETIYTSAVLVPGDVITTAALAVPLAAGEYPCTAEIDVLTADGVLCNTVSIDINVMIKA